MGDPARVLVSACLLGNPVRYDGAAKTLEHPVLDRWIREGRVVPVCPEMLGGLPTPRPAAEISATGAVMDSTGQDVTAAYRAGADAALALAQAQACVAALLTDGSPSCGAKTIHDGSFSGQRIPGQGLAARRLCAAGIPVFTQSEIAKLESFLRSL